MATLEFAESSFEIIEADRNSKAFLPEITILFNCSSNFANMIYVIANQERLQLKIKRQSKRDTPIIVPTESRGYPNENTFKRIFNEYCESIQDCYNDLSRLFPTIDHRVMFSELRVQPIIVRAYLDDLMTIMRALKEHHRDEMRSIATAMILRFYEMYPEDMEEMAKLYLPSELLPEELTPRC